MPVFTVQPQERGMRLDHCLVRLLPGQSRSGLAKLIRSGRVFVNSSPVKPGCLLRPGDSIRVELPAPASLDRPVPQPVAFTVLFEDEHLAVISKPPGLVVHPAAGHSDGTLVNGLLHRYGELLCAEGERPGIVHRLDKDTSGIMLTARTEEMRRLLAAAFKARHIRKTYHALLLRGPAETTGRIDAPVGRHPVNRQKMAVRQRDGRPAVTSWRIVERFRNGCCFAEISIETGRTHQIRVHMSSIGTPVLGDALYGGISKSMSAGRQMLHASVLDFTHPATGQACRFLAPLWPDMEETLAWLRQERGNA